MSKYFEVESRAEAWQKATELFGCEYELDEAATKNAGHGIYQAVKAEENKMNPWISDLDNRLELNMANGETINIHVKEREKVYTALQVKEIITNGRAEIERAEKILALVESMENSRLAQEVTELVRMCANGHREQLAQFGL